MTQLEYLKTINPNASLGEYIRYIKESDPKQAQELLAAYMSPLLNAYKNNMLEESED